VPRLSIDLAHKTYFQSIDYRVLKLPFAFTVRLTDRKRLFNSVTTLVVENPSTMFSFICKCNLANITHTTIS